MLENILDSIICDQFDRTLGRHRTIPEGEPKYSSDSNKAMVVKFSLSGDWDHEDGYRNLTLLIFGGGSNYFSVFAKIDWTVQQEGGEYVKGDTGWSVLGHHDSCWRDAVHTLIWNYRDRIITIDSTFHGWYRIKNVTEEEKEQFTELVRKAYRWDSFTKREHVDLKTAEFRFPKAETAESEVGRA